MAKTNASDADPLGLGSLVGPCTDCGRHGPVEPVPRGKGVTLVCRACANRGSPGPGPKGA